MSKHMNITAEAEVASGFFEAIFDECLAEQNMKLVGNTEQAESFRKALIAIYQLGFSDGQRYAELVAREGESPLLKK